MLTDEEIAAQATPLPLEEVGAKIGLQAKHLIHWGPLAAKIDVQALDVEPRAVPAKLVLVSAITPTPAGEGKTTTSIGLAQGLAQIGESVCVTLREPSLGPYLGKKGGATGGGYSQIVPADRINLHFTGDFHAVTAAHNLLAALLDNHLNFKNSLEIDLRRIVWPRVLDMNDRTLRDVVIGLGGTKNGMPRESGFEITAASEVMAILCLAKDLDDLRERVSQIVVAYTRGGLPVTASDLKAAGAMGTLLEDAIKPNLVQTLEGVPALVHGGPFANIAHGCNSLIATQTAMRLADWVVTEAGFGFDLGAEKFYDIKCVTGGLDTAAVVLVATIRALKMHGGVRRKRLTEPNVDALRAGLANLDKHVESIGHFGERPIVALNVFASDTDAEIDVVRERCQALRVPFVVARHHEKGGLGAVDLARVLVESAEGESTPFRPLYAWEDSVPDKILAVAKSMYGAAGLVLTNAAKADLKEIERLGYAKLPVCMAKTPASLSDDPKLRGRPDGFKVTVRGIKVNAGARFLVVMTGEILRMPGLPRHPRAELL